MSVKHVSSVDFDQEVMQASGPVLVDFWAEWCGPCKMIAPILDEVARDMQGKVTVAKLNVDEDGAVAQRFSIRGIPTLILFKDGKEVAQQVGAVSKSQLVKFLQENVG
ncbi:MAG: thioredoxin TrxA [Betaproteobacteria bacterium]|nr:thioredoxin TrxA [Betaproteobacteria bacterium]